MPRLVFLSNSFKNRLALSGLNPPAAATAVPPMMRAPAGFLSNSFKNRLALSGINHPAAAVPPTGPGPGPLSPGAGIGRSMTGVKSRPLILEYLNT